MQHTRKHLLLLLILALVGLPALAAGALQATPAYGAIDAIVVTFESDEYSLLMNADGSTLIDIDGYAQTGQPDLPLLPERVFYVAIPPAVDPDTVQIEVTGWEQETIAGSYRLALAVPDVTSAGIPAQTPVGDSLSPINQEPASSVSLVSSGQLRKWRFVRLRFSPVLYWPDSGRVDLVTRLDARLTYDLPLGEQDQESLTDTLAEDEAQDLLYNFDDANSWYSVVGTEDMSGENTYDYVIITTNAIRANADNVTKFQYRKQSMGYGVKVVTESDYGSLSGQSPNGTAEKIRQWLINNYQGYGIEYVLLIGDPNPTSGDVPMKMCWPRLGTSSYEEAPTDYFYADLTGNWDLNGDQSFGVWGEDTGDGGVDFAAEVKVGRIPVYNDDYNNLNSILQKIMDYEDEVNPTSWRQNALLPMSFSSTTYDGAPLAEQMKADYLIGASYGTYTLYQQGSGACSLNSSYTSDQELRGGTTVRDRWANNNYGLVLWWGHGSATTAWVGCENCWDNYLFSSSYTSSLNDDQPAIVFQNSCLNGYPENTGNLQYSLLKKGAISAVGATRVSWFNTGVGYGSFDGSTTNSGIGYEYADRIVAGQAAGDALYNAKSSMTPESSTRLMNFYDFNLYGDPSVGVLSQLPPGAPRPANRAWVAPLSESQIQVSWQDNSPNETGFKVEWSLDGVSNWQVLDTVGENVTSIDDSQSPYNVPYYRVAAFNDQGASDYTNSVTLGRVYLPITVRQ